MTIRAKFAVIELQPGHGGTIDAILAPRYDASIPVDQTFHSMTPYGRLFMGINNPKVIEQLEVGKCFYLDLVPVDCDEHKS